MRFQNISQTGLGTKFSERLSRGILALFIAGCVSLGAATSQAQDTDSEEFATTQTAPLTTAELEQIVGPIALYPDDLVGIILPASTYPLQIVQAARFLEQLEDEPNAQPDPDWDNSVVALLNYPEALLKLDEDLDWTWSLGQAVLIQQTTVIDAIQDFREQAYLAGNLESDEHQVVSEEDGAIEITPADPEVIYVPYYEPARVVVAQPHRVYHYYNYGYPVYYYPYPVGYTFRTGFFWGVTSAFSIGWHSHYLHVHHQSHYGHPYYRHPYHSPYYARHGVNININVNSVSHVWQPHHRPAARPHYRTNSNRVVRSAQDYTNDLRRTRQQRSVSQRNAGTQTLASSGTRNRTQRTATATNGRPNGNRTSGTVRNPSQGSSANSRPTFASSNTQTSTATRSRRASSGSNSRAADANRTQSNSSGLAVRNARRATGSIAVQPNSRSATRSNGIGTRNTQAASPNRAGSSNGQSVSQQLGNNGRRVNASAAPGTSRSVNRTSNQRPSTFAATSRPQSTSGRTARAQTQSRNAARVTSGAANRATNARPSTFASSGSRTQSTSQPRARVQTGNRAQTNRGARGTSRSAAPSARSSNSRFARGN